MEALQSLLETTIRQGVQSIFQPVDFSWIEKKRSSDDKLGKPLGVSC